MRITQPTIRLPMINRARWRVSIVSRAGVSSFKTFLFFESSPGATDSFSFLGLVAVDFDLATGVDGGSSFSGVDGHHFAGERIMLLRLGLSSLGASQGKRQKTKDEVRFHKWLINSVTRPMAYIMAGTSYD